MSTLLLTQLFCTLFLCGLCCFVQLVHYPLLKEIPLENIPRCEQKNLRTAYLVVPIMVTELITALLLLYFEGGILFYLNAAGILITGLSTFIFQGPIHLMLAQEASPALIDRLIRTNWIRTISWCLRSALLLWIVWNTAVAIQ